MSAARRLLARRRAAPGVVGGLGTALALVVLAAPLSTARAAAPQGASAAPQQGQGAESAREAGTDRATRQELEPKKPEDSTRPFFYLFPSAAQIGMDTSRIGSERFSDTVTVFVPAVVSVRTSDERSRFYAIYEPQLERFAEHQELNSWNHSGAVAFDHEIGPRLTVGAGGSVLKTADPTRAIAELPLVLDRGEFVSARGYLSLGYRVTRRTFFDLTVDRGLVRYDALAGEPDVGIDSVGNGVIVGLSHRISQAHSFAVRYAYVDERALEGPDELPEDLAVLLPLAPQHGVDVGWTYDAARGLTLFLSGGVAYGDRLSWLARATVEKEWRYLRLMVGYQRLLGSFENLAPARTPSGQLDIDQPLLPVSTLGTAADILGASVEGRAGRLRLASRLQLSLSSFAGQGPYLDGLTASGGIKLDLSDHLQPYVQAEYITQGLSPEVGLRRSRGRYTAGLVLVLGPRPRNTSLQLELERRRALLPYAGAKRPW